MMPITALIPTSPIASHPSTEIIEATVASIRERLECRILILADGVRPEQAEVTEAYNHYLDRLYRLCRHEWDALLYHAPTWIHQANLTREGLRRTDTPLILFVEHDTPLTGQIPFEPIAKVVTEGYVDVVRFYHETVLQREHVALMVGDSHIGGVPLRLTRQWSQRPHLADKAFYQQMIHKLFPITSRTMIEDRVHGPAQTEPWRDWRIAIYNPRGNLQRSLHLDGRGEADKYEMRFE